MRMNPLLMTDFYKVDHIRQYPKGTQYVYSNLTPRKSRIPGVNAMVFFGLQYFIKEYLIKIFNEEFFLKPESEIMASYERRIKNSIGPLPTYNHIKRLHDLGYLPILIKALPEGSKVPMRVPAFTMVNTIPEFYWLTNFLESLISCIIWMPCTSATIANEYRKIFEKYGKETGVPPEFIQWQGHDFSFRGMAGFEAVVLSGMAHLLSFTGTDSIPAIDGLEQYYNADCEKELIGGSVAATEHSVMCAGSKDGELETFRRLIVEVYPSGIISIVSDTWDLWTVLTKYMPELKDIIMKRDGKVVIRPDSGDPVDIICGLNSGKYAGQFKDEDAFAKFFEIGGRNINNYQKGEWKGVIEHLWDVFGGTTTKKGFRMLDIHVGGIYGDSITMDRAVQISERLKSKNFASQLVFGIGSYTYQYQTRDTFGMAMKATHVIVNGESRDIFKKPVTDDGTKISATGLLRVDWKDGAYVLKERCTPQEEAGGELKTVFVDGKLTKDWTLAEIRANIRK